MHNSSRFSLSLFPNYFFLVNVPFLSCFPSNGLVLTYLFENTPINRPLPQCFLKYMTNFMPSVRYPLHSLASPKITNLGNLITKETFCTRWQLKRIEKLDRQFHCCQMMLDVTTRTRNLATFNQLPFHGTTFATCE